MREFHHLSRVVFRRAHARDNFDQSGQTMHFRVIFLLKVKYTWSTYILGPFKLSDVLVDSSEQILHFTVT